MLYTCVLQYIHVCCIHDMLCTRYGTVYLPALALGFLLGTCGHPLAIGARSCCCAVCEREGGGRGRGVREGETERGRGR